MLSNLFSQKAVHWGWYWKVKRKHKPKSVCDFETCIDSFHCYKQPDFCGFTLKEGSSNEIKAILNGNMLSISCSEGSYEILVEKQACYYGGFRHFFRCPHPTCNRRMRKLYQWGCLFLCRQCLKLGYYSQRLLPSRRLSRRERKIEQKLMRLGGNKLQKPKWMRRKTFEIMKAKEHHYYCAAEKALWGECYKFYGVYP